MKKFIAFIFAALFAVVSFADTEKVGGVTYTYSIANGEATIGNGIPAAITTLTSGALVIPSTLGGCPVTTIGESAFHYCSSLTSVTIPSSVTTIGLSAFRDCSSLTSVTIPDSVTTIGVSAFRDCRSLTSVTIPEGVTTIGNYAFYGCESLTSVTIPKSVMKIGSYAFSSTPFYNNQPDGFIILGKGCLYKYKGTCPAEVIIPDGVTTIGDYAFYDCWSLTSVTIPEGVTTIGTSAFENCRSLTSVMIPASVTAIDRYAFQFCSSLTSVTIPESVTTIGDYAFYNCSSLRSVTIPSSVTTIGEWAFSYCSSLTSVTIPESVTTIGDCAFRDCRSLTSVTIPESVTTIGERAFNGCSKLTSVTIPSSVTKIARDAFAGCSSLTSVNVEEGDVARVKGLLREGGADVDALTFVEIPRKLADGGPYKETVNGVEYTFLISNGEVTIGDGFSAAISQSTSGALTIPSTLGGCPVTTIGNYAFFGHGSLTSVTIPDGVKTIGVNAFSYCRSLTSVTIPASVTTIEYSAFLYCDSLKSVTIPESVIKIDRAFGYNEKLESFIIVDANRHYCSIDGVLYTKDGLIIVACPGVKTSVTILDGVTTIEDGAFIGCQLLTSVTIPPSVTTIEDGVFEGCYSLASVTIPEGVTTIGDWAFNACRSLISVTIPSSVTTIGKGAFESCSSLSEVWVESGDEDRVKGLLSNSGFDVAPVTFREIPKQESDPGEGKHHITFVVSDGEASLAEANYPTNGVYGRLPEARREGFTFAGWYTAFDGGMRVGAFSTINPEVTTLYARWVEQDASLYAQWAANAYTVNFNANGGSGAMAAQQFLYDQTQPLSANGFTKPGYTFKGWSTSPEGEVVFADAAAVSNLTAEAGFTVALFAQWNKAVELEEDEISDWVIYDLADQFAVKHGVNARGYRDLFKATFGNDYSAAFYKETGKVAADGTRLQVWHDYVAGTDPLDSESKFTATMTMVNGKPVISWTPELDAERAAMRKYTTYGKRSLLDSDWEVVPVGQESEYNFFKVSVEMR